MLVFSPKGSEYARTCHRGNPGREERATTLVPRRVNIHWGWDESMSCPDTRKILSFYSSFIEQSAFRISFEDQIFGNWGQLFPDIFNI